MGGSPSPVDVPGEPGVSRSGHPARDEVCGLTPREKDVLTLLAQGHDYAEMEGELFVSHNTLKTHVHHIYAKTGVHSRQELLELLGV